MVFADSWNLQPPECDHWLFGWCPFVECGRCLAGWQCSLDSGLRFLGPGTPPLSPYDPSGIFLPTILVLPPRVCASAPG